MSVYFINRFKERIEEIQKISHNQRVSYVFNIIADRSVEYILAYFERQ